MRLDLSLLASACAAALASGCIPPDPGGTDSGNAFQAELTVAGEGELVSAARDVASLDSATLFLREVEFEACSGGGEDAEVDYEGNYETDLLAGTALGIVDLSIDSVCEVEVEAEAEDGEPSIEIEGLSTGGLAFRVVSREKWEWTIESDLPLTQDEVNQLFLLFDLDAWLAGVDPDTGTDVNGIILIDEQYNTDLLSVFEANVALTGTLEDDD